ncbi:uncharacterized protein OCT59_006103 [Rhizophagus irregularis]|uniref:DUF8211 domain-containing protein n=1 Tax=Rhizophagus irregularis (strain DAOM 181602 / DAOM 197198 / MUCL 43194) TaxID=747089 RepID=A0A2P4P2E5_RHIID|nr:hypothetical protein GLOIN_2v1788988 [Rhizophagus irregularis DAOM 181602=DAOM 197198]POG59559.1 hypothetical protein GLOIN_2v1788988 [Rhizophagus irregularis DAOM 181602=DAOM 197198]UZO14651.1 hypothetical protein OCT59_006103 [Rhizophagus irregularis]|eukprot:XP_025166425.1 hypothetical protein GLOIN_2v1788988 [Rhizophagus irregularis DAOM 181602=DAOM 197198]
MSDFRRACVLHQPLFFKNDVFTHIKNPKKDLNIDHENISINSKAYHANLLYTRWNSHRTKQIYSQRLGISFDKMIHARDRYSITHLNNKHIYRKKLTNFSIERSHNPRVSKAQEIHFDRAKRRIFHKKEHNLLDLEHHKIATAQRYRFMFTKSQFVLRLIKHLLYNHGLHHRNYKFWTPFFGRSGKRIRTTTFDDTSSPVLNSTVAPYNLIPNMFIPYKYRNIIPKEPLYTDEGVYIVPEDAILHGTSFNRVNIRKYTAFTLTNGDHFHYEMTEFKDQYLESDDDNTKSRIDMQMNNFSAQFKDIFKRHIANIP